MILTNIVQNENEFSGSAIIGQGTGLCGSGPFSGVIRSNGDISFTIASNDSNCPNEPMMYIGSLHTDGTMSGTYTVGGGDQQGT